MRYCQKTITKRKHLPGCHCQRKCRSTLKEMQVHPRSRTIEGVVSCLSFPAFIPQLCKKQMHSRLNGRSTSIKSAILMCIYQRIDALYPWSGSLSRNGCRVIGFLRIRHRAEVRTDTMSEAVFRRNCVSHLHHWNRVCISVLHQCTSWHSTLVLKIKNRHSTSPT